jgi:hypothetical protein
MKQAKLFYALTGLIGIALSGSVLADRHAPGKPEVHHAKAEVNTPHKPEVHHGIPDVHTPGMHQDHHGVPEVRTPGTPHIESPDSDD